MQHITLIDKDRAVLNSLKSMLSDEGYRVECHTDPQQALRAMRAKRTNLAVMDMKMPRIDGISMLEKMRSFDEDAVPIVFLSSDEDHTNEVMALRMGAEDYVRKPFAPRVLLERLRNCLRRAEETKHVSDDNKPRKVLVHGNLEADPNTLRVKWKGHEITLTATEFEMLYYLVENPDYVRSRTQIMDRIYGDGVFVEERVIDSHLKRVRKKIRDIDPDFSAIETIYGAGYRFSGARA